MQEMLYKYLQSSRHSLKLEHRQHRLFNLGLKQRKDINP